MINCPNCNHQNPDGALQCEACYTPLPALANCPNCDATIQADASFCGQCGSDLREETLVPSGGSSTAEPNVETTGNAISSLKTQNFLEPEGNSEPEPAVPELVSPDPLLVPDPISTAPTVVSAAGTEISSTTTEAMGTAPEMSAPEVEPASEMTAPEMATPEIEPASEMAAPEVAASAAPSTPAAQVEESSFISTEPEAAHEAALAHEAEAEAVPTVAPEVEAVSADPASETPAPATPAPMTPPPVSLASGVPPASPRRSPATQLQVLSARLRQVQTDTSIEIPGDLSVVRIGKPNDHTPPDIDVSGFPDSEIVSRTHANIRVEGDTYYLEDVGSSNGTYINGLPLPVGNRHRLRPGDRIALGKGDKVSFIFEMAS